MRAVQLWGCNENVMYSHGIPKVTRFRDDIIVVKRMAAWHKLVQKYIEGLGSKATKVDWVLNVEEIANKVPYLDSEVEFDGVAMNIRPLCEGECRS